MGLSGENQRSNERKRTNLKKQKWVWSGNPGGTSATVQDWDRGIKPERTLGPAPSQMAHHSHDAAGIRLHTREHSDSPPVSSKIILYNNQSVKIAMGWQSSIRLDTDYRTKTV